MKNFKILLLSALSIILMSCGNDTDNNNDSSLNKFIVGTSADNPPYEFIENGNIVGFDIDIAREIAKEMNEQLIIKNVDFNGLIPALVSRNVDIVVAGISVTPERQINIDFTDNYYSSEMALIFKKSLDIDESSNISDLRIGAQFTTTWEAFANAIVENSTKGSVKSLPNNLLLIQDIKNDNIDLAVMEKFQVEKFSKLNPDFKYIILPESSTDFAIALPKNSYLTEKINQILNKLKENGKIDELKQKWFAK